MFLPLGAAAKWMTGSEMEGRYTMMLDYGEFYMRYSCDNRAAEYVHYTTKPDEGNEKRYKPFHVEKRLPSDCPSQRSPGTYRSKSITGQRYDRGHLLIQNVVDFDRSVMKKTNIMTNIVPMEATQNRSGLWRTLEKRVECTRDIEEVEMWLGVVWGEHEDKNVYKKSHGVTVPEYLFRIHRYGNTNKVFVWLIPNTKEANSKTEHLYRVTDEHLNTLMHIYDFDTTEMVTDVDEVDPYKGITCSYS